MKKILDEVLGFFKKEWSMGEKVLFGALLLLIGIMKGFCLASVKRSISCKMHHHSCHGEHKNSRWCSEVQHPKR